MKEIKQIPIDDIRIDGGTQLRADIDQATVAEYAEKIDELPRSDVFNDGAHIWLADGFHRYHGHKRAGRKTMLCEVHKGTQRDAILFALGANAGHGLRRSNADKRKAIIKMLNDPEWSAWSDRKIAEQCQVGHQLVSEVRAAHLDEKPDAPAARTVERSGKTYPMDTRRIAESNAKRGKSENGNGKHPPAPTADDEVEIIPSVNQPAATNGKHKPDAKPEPVKDAEGQEIKSPKLVELWNRRQEITEMMTTVSRMKSSVLRSIEGKDQLFAHVTGSQFQAACATLYNILRFAKPYALCPYCGGVRGCKACKLSGFVGEEAFKHYVPEDLKV